MEPVDQIIIIKNVVLFNKDIVENHTSTPYPQTKSKLVIVHFIVQTQYRASSCIPNPE